MAAAPPAWAALVLNKVLIGESGPLPARPCRHAFGIDPQRVWEMAAFVGGEAEIGAASGGKT